MISNKFDWSKLDYRLFDVGLALAYFCSSWEGVDSGELWLDKVALFVRAYQDGEADRLASVLDPIEGIATLTSNAILDAARTYLNEQNYVKVVLMPETK